MTTWRRSESAKSLWFTFCFSAIHLKKSRYALQSRKDFSRLFKRPSSNNQPVHIPSPPYSVDTLNNPLSAWHRLGHAVSVDNLSLLDLNTTSANFGLHLSSLAVPDAISSSGVDIGSGKQGTCRIPNLISCWPQLDWPTSFYFSSALQLPHSLKKASADTGTPGNLEDLVSFTALVTIGSLVFAFISPIFMNTILYFSSIPSLQFVIPP
ncbi:unnamed protein product [Protopolystoma xenopodis]|uniref:Uncharacterized protein n=1 Tax=Protopolystoma xenopodis TaxID=117903 RepID=A0A448XF62_9PLAT|nr:unnamed protein product [Protopolystoma xenopodis]